MVYGAYSVSKYIPVQLRFWFSVSLHAPTPVALLSTIILNVIISQLTMRTAHLSICTNAM